MGRPERRFDAGVNSGAPEWLIVGQGLAGTCLAWCLWKRGVPFRIADDGAGGSSLVAAGLINPITGKNFEPSHGLAIHLPEAAAFYQDVETRIGRRVWHAMPVLRLASGENEWRKIELKLDREDIRPWISDARPDIPPGPWSGAVELRGGGRLDTVSFLHGSRDFFDALGVMHRQRIDPDHGNDRTIWCEGAAGILRGACGPHRCAKGEILTLRAEGFDETRIRIGAGGWLVPIGGACFKAGATYEWEKLDREPTAEGRSRVEEIATRLMERDFEVIAHEAGIRPILRRSDPLLARLPDGAWVFNGLGSKGSLYAPGVADRLALWMLDGAEPDERLRYRTLPCPPES